MNQLIKDPGSCRLEKISQLLKTSQELRDCDREEEAIALGPDILLAYFALENGHELDRDAPKTFREKLYCRMLDIHEKGSPLFSRLSDKYHARSYVAEKIGEQYLTNLIWHGSDATDIPWESLPEACILKCTEGSGKNQELIKPSAVQQVTALCRQWQTESYYWFRREYHYYGVPRHLIIEEMLSDGHPDGPIDYIFFCFDGIPRLVQVGSRSHTIHRFFTPTWQPLNLGYKKDCGTSEIPRPRHLDEMLNLASQLSSDFDFVRVDLYDCGDSIKFGEMTFTPRAGKLPFQPEAWNEILGNYWSYRGWQPMSINGWD